MNPTTDPHDSDGTADARSLELVARVRAGDLEAFGDLYRRYHDELLFAVRAHLGPRLRTKLQSEDILQSVVVDAIRALPQVRAETPAGLRHYLNTMILNKIRGRAAHFNADKRAGDVLLSPSGAGAIVAREDGELGYHDSERYERLEHALNALPEEMRRLVLLRRIDGLGNVEAAELMHKSEEATRKLYSRAMARLTLGLGPPAATD